MTGKAIGLVAVGTLRASGRPTDLWLGGWFLESDFLEVSKWPITLLTEHS